MRPQRQETSRQATVRNDDCPSLRTFHPLLVDQCRDVGADTAVPTRTEWPHLPHSLWGHSFHTPERDLPNVGSRCPLVPPVGISEPRVAVVKGARQIGAHQVSRLIHLCPQAAFNAILAKTGRKMACSRGTAAI
jgi:hypothetical protein